MLHIPKAMATAATKIAWGYRFLLLVRGRHLEAMAGIKSLERCMPTNITRNMLSVILMMLRGALKRTLDQKTIPTAIVSSIAAAMSSRIIALGRLICFPQNYMGFSSGSSVSGSCSPNRIFVGTSPSCIPASMMPLSPRILIKGRDIY